MHDQQDIRIYYIRQNDKAYYTLDPIGLDEAWEVIPEIVLPYLMEFPNLLYPQTIH